MKELHAMTDESLAIEYTKGNNRAFDILLDRNQDSVYSFIRFMIKDPDVADDIFQDTFVKAIIKLQENKYCPTGKFGAWLMRIAHNLVIDYFRTNKKVIDIDFDEPANVSKYCADMKDSYKEKDYVNSQVLQDVKKLMNSLPDVQREVVYMRMYQNIPFKDIADITNCSINTALGRMRYAIINMRRMAEEKNMSLALI